MSLLRLPMLPSAISTMRCNVLGLPVCAVLLWLAFASQHVGAHSLSPSLVELVESEPAAFSLRLKQPLKRAQVEPVETLLPTECVAVGRWDEQRTLDSRILQSSVTCGGGLAGTTLTFPRLAESAASLVLKVRWQSGASFIAVVKASEPAVLIPVSPSPGRVFADYFLFGLEHLVTGLDHLLFLVALVLLVQHLRPLVAVVTAFTLGHALSVVLVTLQVFSLPAYWVEVSIALSIVVLALDVFFRVREHRGVYRTALLCAAFGVLHGMGFASALDIDALARADKAMALLAFNLGIEAAQLVIVTLIAVLLWLLLARLRLPEAALLKPAACLIGVAGALWFWERLLGYMVQAQLL